MNTLHVRDDLGRPIALPAPPRRVVSLVPSMSQMVCDLGLASRLVGITSFCNDPRESLAGKRRIGGTKTPKLDRIRALEPDLVLANAEENRREDLEALEASGVPVAIAFPRDIPSAIAMLRWVGRALGAEERAAELADGVEADVARVRAAAARRPRVKVFHPIWKDPWMHFNRDTFLHHALEAVGAANPTEGAPERYPVVTLAEIAEAGVEAILLPDEPYRFKESDLPEIRRALAATPAVRQGRIAFVDGKAGTWHGYRLGRSLVELFRAVHGVAPA